MNPEPTREEKIRDEVKILIENGFFEVKSGQILIDKHNGMIQNIKISTTIYKRGKGLDINP